MAGWHNTSFGVGYQWSKTVNFTDFLKSMQEVYLIAGLADPVPRMLANFEDVSGGAQRGAFNDFSAILAGRWDYFIYAIQKGIEDAVGSGGVFVKVGSTITGAASTADFSWQMFFDESLVAGVGPGLLKYAGCPLDSTGLTRNWTRKRPARIADVLSGGVASNFDDTCDNPAYNTPAIGQIAWNTATGFKYQLQSVSGVNTWVFCDQRLDPTIISGSGKMNKLDYIGHWLWGEMYLALNALSWVQNPLNISYSAAAPSAALHRRGYSDNSTGSTRHNPGTSLADAKSKAIAEWNSSGEVNVGSGDAVFSGQTYTRDDIGLFIAEIVRDRSINVMSTYPVVAGASLTVEIYSCSTVPYAFQGAPDNRFGTMGDSIPGNNAYALIATPGSGGSYTISTTTTVPPWSTTVLNGGANGQLGEGYAYGGSLILAKWTRAYS